MGEEGEGQMKKGSRIWKGRKKEENEKRMGRENEM